MTMALDSGVARDVSAPRAAPPKRPLSAALGPATLAGRISVSVVVPTYNRPALLDRCLRALLMQDFDPEDYEIIVANDKPDAATRDAVARLRAEWGPAASIHYLPVTRGDGPAAARNAGWRIACGRVVAFTDDDTIPSRRWLREGLRALTPQVAAVSGRTLVPLPPRPTDYERDAAGLEAGEFVTANCFVHRSVLEAVGGFDERFRAAWREDSDLHFTLLERGGSIVRAPEAVVLHPVRPAPWGVSLQQQRKVQYDALLYKKHPELYRQRLRPGVRWDYYTILLFLLLAPAALLAGRPLLAAACLAGWGLMTLAFALRRLRGTSRDPRHIAEMLFTSAAIPPLSIWWRLTGALRYRVAFF